MMTAKEYVEGKVKSYTRLAERCKREAAYLYKVFDSSMNVVYMR